MAGNYRISTCNGYIRKEGIEDCLSMSLLSLPLSTVNPLPLVWVITPSFFSFDMVRDTTSLTVPVMDATSPDRTSVAKSKKRKVEGFRARYKIVVWTPSIRGAYMTKNGFTAEQIVKKLRKVAKGKGSYRGIAQGV